MKPTRPITLTAVAKDKLHKVSTATLTSQLILHGFKNTFLSGLWRLSGNGRMVGYAVTVRFVPAREDMNEKMADLANNPQRQSVESVGPDDVLVMAARGETRGAVIGDIFAMRMKQLGAAGFVTDGSVRDTPGCAEIGLPIYLKARQATRSNVWHHPADWNVPVGCAGVLIEPRDIIIGDEEGVVAIPAHVAEAVAHASYEQEIKETFVLERVEAGQSTIGLYPFNDEMAAEFTRWREAKGL
ncbi:MAG: ribonuclease activity regulator RraA [Chloroflexota bacterium]